MKRDGRELVFDLPVACVSQSERESVQLTPLSSLTEGARLKSTGPLARMATGSLGICGIVASKIATK